MPIITTGVLSGSGDIQTRGDITSEGDVNVTGSIAFEGDISGSTHWYVGSDMDINGDIYSSGSAYFGGSIGIGNTVPGGSDLEVTTTAASSEATRPTIEISSFSDANDLYTSAGVLKFHKSANDTVNIYGANSHTATGEVIGRIEAWGVTNDDDNSSDAPKLSSYIEFSGDAVADETDVPGKIVFATADADDAGSPTERVRIDDGGNVGIGNPDPGSTLEISKVSGQPSLELSAWSTTATAAHAGALKFQKAGTAITLLLVKY